MTQQIKIGRKIITEELIGCDEVIFIAKYEGEVQPFYTLLTAKPDADRSNLESKLYLTDCNLGASHAFWSQRVSECEFKCTNIPAFRQCLNMSGKYAHLIKSEFKF